jgi:hypothetical protein
VIAQTRRLFPKSWLVGWKYELAGTREEALAKARRQIYEACVDACIVNGKAYGNGFGIVEPPNPIMHKQTKLALVKALTGHRRLAAASRIRTK